MRNKMRKRRDAGRGRAENQHPNPNVIVSILVLDALTPVTPAASKVSVNIKFKHQKVMKIDGEPTHAIMTLTVRELARNTITSNASFGCKKQGCLGVMKDPAIYKTESGNY